MCMSSPKIPSVPAATASTDATSTVDTSSADTREAVRSAQETERALISRKKGRTSTILTGSQGLTEEATIAKKSLLGA